jgi:hypothetical protein
MASLNDLSHLTFRFQLQLLLRSQQNSLFGNALRRTAAHSLQAADQSKKVL